MELIWAIVDSARIDDGVFFLNMNDSASKAQPNADACNIVRAISGSQSDANNNVIASIVNIQIFPKRLI